MSEVKKDESDLSAMLCADFSTAATAKDIYPIVSCTNAAFIRGEFEEVNEYIDSVDVEIMSPLARICLVRSTVCAKKKLSNWGALRDRVAATLEEPERLLRGLYAT